MPQPTATDPTYGALYSSKGPPYGTRRQIFDRKTIRSTFPCNQRKESTFSFHRLRHQNIGSCDPAAAAQGRDPSRTHRDTRRCSRGRLRYPEKGITCWRRMCRSVKPSLVGEDWTSSNLTSIVRLQIAVSYRYSRHGEAGARPVRGANFWIRRLSRLSAQTRPRSSIPTVSRSPIPSSIRIVHGDNRIFLTVLQGMPPHSLLRLPVPMA